MGAQSGRVTWLKSARAQTRRVRLSFARKPDAPPASSYLRPLPPPLQAHLLCPLPFLWPQPPLQCLTPPRPPLQGPTWIHNKQRSVGAAVVSDPVSGPGLPSKLPLPPHSGVKTAIAPLQGRLISNSGVTWLEAEFILRSLAFPGPPLGPRHPAGGSRMQSQPRKPTHVLRTARREAAFVGRSPGDTEPT